MKFLASLLSLSLILFAAQSQATPIEIAYKCTEEDGTISFLDKKPTSGCVDIEVVNLADGSAIAAEDIPEDVAAAEQARAEQEIEARRQKQIEECKKLDRQLSILTENAQVILPDPETGEKRVLSAEEHQEKIEQIEGHIKLLCSKKEEKKKPAAESEDADSETETEADTGASEAE